MTDKPDKSEPEHVRARYWREQVVKMSRPALAEAIGYSVSTIGDMEAGMNRITKKPIEPAAMKRYRLLCAAVGLDIEFDWDALEMIIVEPVRLSMWGKLRVRSKRK